MNRLQTVVGIIVNENKQICIAQRAHGKHLAGRWEFPGGKIEANETHIAALTRELYEELDITVTNATPIVAVPYDYPADNRYVTLHFYLVDQFDGEAYGKEDQPIKWVALSQLKEYNFPQANDPVIAMLPALLDESALEA